MRLVYMDNNATTRVDPNVLDAMLPYFGDEYGNASSKHALGMRAHDALHAARGQVRALIGAALDPEIVFTSGGTEANNTALQFALDSQSERNEVITSAVEHPAVLAVCEQLEKRHGLKVHRLGVDSQGRLDIEAYRRLLGPRTALVSIMWANNETGTLFPVAELAALARNAGALFHTDAVQALGKVPVDVKSTAIDLLSLSAHKIHGPKGCGALYVRKGVRFRPLLHGGRQERGRRAGTENVPAIVGFGKAAELAAARLHDDAARIEKLRDRLERGLLSIGGTLALGDRKNRLPNTANVAFEFVESDALLTLLGRYDIAASSGSACASGSLEVSHVLRAMRVNYTYAHGAVRFSLSRETGNDDVDRVLEALPPIVDVLRSQSTSIPAPHEAELVGAPGGSL